MLVSTSSQFLPPTFRLEPPAQSASLLDGVSEGEGGPPEDDESVRVLHTSKYQVSTENW